MSVTVLNRSSSSVQNQEIEWTKAQVQTDTLVSKFTEEAFDVNTLLPIMAGGAAYRLGRIGTMGLHVGAYCNTPLRMASLAVGLGSEVMAFEFTNRLLASARATGQSPLQNQSPITDHRSPNLWSWSGPGGWQEGLASSALTFGLLRGAGFLARGQNIVLQHALQSTAVVGGHQISGALRISPAPQGSLAEQFLHAEVTNLQMIAGTGLVNSLSPQWTAFERGLDLALSRIEANSGQNLQNPSLVFALALPSPERRSSHSETGIETHLLHMRGERDRSIPNEEEAKSIEGRYRKFFPSDFLPRARMAHIVFNAAFTTPCKQEGFHDRLMEAYASVPNRGTTEQAYTALAIKDLFQFSAIDHPTGSYQNALLQLLIRRIMADDNGDHRKNASAELFLAMERGLRRSDLQSIFQKFGYADDLSVKEQPMYPAWFEDLHSSFVREYWSGYRPSDRILLLNTIFEMAGNQGHLVRQLIMHTTQGRENYPPELVDEVLKEARENPLGGMILRKLIQVFRVEDAQAKLRELLPGKPSDSLLPTALAAEKPSWWKKAIQLIPDRWRPALLGSKKEAFSPSLSLQSVQAIHRLATSGYSKDDIADRINGTVHTAYLNDLRLARKIVTISLKVFPYVQERSSLRSLQRDQLKKVILKQLKEKTTQPQPKDYLTVLKKLEMEPPPWILEEIRKGTLFLQVLSDAEFDADEYALAGSKKHLSRFLSANPERGTPHRIQIRQISDDLLKPHTESQRMKEFTERLLSIPHELGHYKMMTGLDEEIRGYPEGPLLMGNRPQVLASEIIAFLEEQPLRSRYWEIEPWIISNRLGENLPLYVRMVNEHIYFRGVNERLMEGLMPLR